MSFIKCTNSASHYENGYGEDDIIQNGIEYMVYKIILDHPEELNENSS